MVSKKKINKGTIWDNAIVKSIYQYCSLSFFLFYFHFLTPVLLDTMGILICANYIFIVTQIPT